ncbi:MAG TPA: cytochrome d ubiquinol oxidase subunit II [Candidatus Eisenbacteria bacterium]|jgi:cytochrome d ubiquinol oxidase subunit II
METLWFCLVAIMLALYVVFDGLDLGAGIVHLLVARQDRERRLVLRSIGPVWDGNEVWLLAAGGTLYFAFPALYASSFSGFYLPLMMVLWLLILRGISIEFRNHLGGPVWPPFWDVVFSASSALLAIFFGAALGNVVRGVPLDSDGHFFEPLWTSWHPRGETGILDWYTVSVGLAALFSLMLHGALWVSLKTVDRIRERSRRLVVIAWWGTAVLTVLITMLTFRLQPQVPANLAARPWGHVFPALAVAGLIAVWWFVARRSEAKAFFASSAYLIGMLSSAAFGLYPYVLPSVGDPSLGLTVRTAAAAETGLRIGLGWWIPGILLVALYFIYTYRQFAGKVTLDPGAGY